MTPFIRFYTVRTTDFFIVYTPVLSTATVPIGKGGMRVARASCLYQRFFYIKISSMWRKYIFPSPVQRSFSLSRLKLSLVDQAFAFTISLE